MATPTIPPQKHNPGTGIPSSSSSSSGFFTRLIRSTLSFFRNSPAPVNPRDLDLEACLPENHPHTASAPFSSRYPISSTTTITTISATPPPQRKSSIWKSIRNIFRRRSNSNGNGDNGNGTNNEGNNASKGYDNPPNTLLPVVMSTTILAGIIPAVPAVYPALRFERMRGVADIGVLGELAAAAAAAAGVGLGNVDAAAGGREEEMAGEDDEGLRVGRDEYSEEGNSITTSQLDGDYYDDEEEIEEEEEEDEEVYDFESLNSEGYQADIDSTIDYASSDHRLSVDSSVVESGDISDTPETEVHRNNFPTPPEILLQTPSDGYDDSNSGSQTPGNYGHVHGHQSQSRITELDDNYHVEDGTIISFPSSYSLPTNIQHQQMPTESTPLLQSSALQRYQPQPRPQHQHQPQHQNIESWYIYGCPACCGTPSTLEEMFYASPLAIQYNARITGGSGNGSGGVITSAITSGNSGEREIASGSGDGSGSARTRSNTLPSRLYIPIHPRYTNSHRQVRLQRNRNRAYTSPTTNPRTGSIVSPPSSGISRFFSSILSRITPRSPRLRSLLRLDDTTGDGEVDANGDAGDRRRVYTWAELSEMEYLDARRRGWGY
ncbi:hypothetical protein BZA77DRAFT_369556 [Pyronema omphalodes]|nr:hypothetical protein BZA77DRAFT_369556 [Pyronema omphalodes]